MADSGGAGEVPPCDNFDPELVNQCYYHGWLPRDDLPYLLQRNGDFLVRLTEGDSMGTRLSMVLSALHDPEGRYTHKRRGHVDEKDIVHIIIQGTHNKYYMDDLKLFNTVDDLIDHFSRHTIHVRNLKVKIRRAVCLAYWEFRAQDIRLGASIGKSGCIEVRKGSFQRDGKFTDASVTTVRGRSSYAKHTILEMMRQCRMLRDLHHPCVVDFYGVCLLTHPCCFLLEYVSEGPLDEYLRKGQGTFKRDELLQMVMSAGWGIEYIHANGIIHRDIGARNCFYDKQLVKISGFGLARKASVYTMKSLMKLSVHWMAPETVEEFLYTYKSDVYAFGILTYEIFSQKEPYEGFSNQEAKAFILDGRINDFPPKTPKELAEYVNTQLWNNDPDDRPTMEQAIDWLSKYTGMKLQMLSLGMSGATVHQNFAAPVMKDVDYKVQEEKAPPAKPVVPVGSIRGVSTLERTAIQTHPFTKAGQRGREVEAQKMQQLEPLSFFKQPEMATKRVETAPISTPELTAVSPSPVSPISRTATAKMPFQTATAAEYENLGAFQAQQLASPVRTHEVFMGTKVHGVQPQMTKHIPTPMSQVLRTASVPTELMSAKHVSPSQVQMPPASPIPVAPVSIKPVNTQVFQPPPIPAQPSFMKPLTTPIIQLESPRTQPIPAQGIPTHPITAQLPRTAQIPPHGPTTQLITPRLLMTSSIPAHGTPTQPIQPMPAQFPKTSPILTPGTPTHPITGQPPKTPPIPAQGAPTHPFVAQSPKTASVPGQGPPTRPMTPQSPKTTSIPPQGFPAHPMTPQSPKTASIPPQAHPTHPITAQFPKTAAIPVQGPQTLPITPQSQKIAPIPPPVSPTHPITGQLPRTPSLSAHGTPTHPVTPQFQQQSPKSSLDTARTTPLFAHGTPMMPAAPVQFQQTPTTSPLPLQGVSPKLNTARTTPLFAPGTPMTPATPLQFQQTPTTSPLPVQGVSPKLNTARTTPLLAPGTPMMPPTPQQFQQTLKTSPVPTQGLPVKPTTQIFQQQFPPASPFPTSLATKPNPSAMNQGLLSSAKLM